MQRFSNFLSEAKVSKSNLNKVADIFKRIIEKNLGLRLYRFGGDKGFTEVKNGVGILYIATNKRAIRLNYVKGEITSLTLWTSFNIAKKGDFTIDLSGMGLLEAGKRLIEVIKNPKTGKVAAYPALVENSMMLQEAKRVKPSEFYDIINKNLPGGISMNNIPRSIMADIAAVNDISIPSVVRYDTKIDGTKGENLRYDLTLLLSDPGIETDKVSKDNEPIYYMKITAQDPNTKKFLSVKGDRKAEEILKKASNAVENPDYQTHMLDPDTRFGHMSDLVSLVARGNRNSLVIYGGAGIGKTYVVTETIGNEGLQKNKDWIMIKGKITTSALYQTLFMHRKGTLLVFDDTDSIWGDAEAANILKAALDSYDERTISWVSPRNTNVSLMNDEEKAEYNSSIDDRLLADPGDAKIKLPTEFAYNGKIIFISNLKEEKFDKAVLNRSAKINMELTQEEIFTRMKSILQFIGDNSVPMAVKEEIFEYIYEASGKRILNNVSMRTFVAAEDLYKSGLPNWKDLLIYQ
jgi:hypothetical protein